MNTYTPMQLFKYFDSRYEPKTLRKIRTFTFHFAEGRIYATDKVLSNEDLKLIAALSEEEAQELYDIMGIYSFMDTVNEVESLMEKDLGP